MMETNGGSVVGTLGASGNGVSRASLSTLSTAHATGDAL